MTQTLTLLTNATQRPTYIVKQTMIAPILAIVTPTMKNAQPQYVTPWQVGHGPGRFLQIAAMPLLL